MQDGHSRGSRKKRQRFYTAFTEKTGDHRERKRDPCLRQAGFASLRMTGQLFVVTSARGGKFVEEFAE